MKPKELAEKTGLKERTIRFYEEQGLLVPAVERRNGRNYRDYTEDDVQRLKTIATLRRARFTLEEIQVMLEEDGAVETVFPAYLQRIEQEADSVQRLRDVAQLIRPTGLSPQRLAEQLEQSAKYLELPQADLSPHFGRFDPETPEEKQRAIEAYRKRQARKRLPVHYWVVAGLSILCILLAVGCAGIFLHTREPAVEPPPNGTTEGYIYYKAYENGMYYICRYQEGTGAVERIYESQEIRMSFVTAEEKVYVDDGVDIYSMNSDGSGKYRIFNGTAGGTTYGHMAVYDGMLYVNTNATVRPLAKLVTVGRIPLDGGDLEELEGLGSMTDFSIVDGYLYTDFGGVITVTDLQTMKSREYEIGSSPTGCIMDGSTIYEVDGQSVGRFSDNTKEPVTITAYAPNDAGMMEHLYEQDLSDYLIPNDIQYIHDGIVYFYETIINNSGDTIPLRALNMETGEVITLSEAPKQGVTDLYWGEHGLLIATSPDTPQYYPYPTFSE